MRSSRLASSGSGNTPTSGSVIAEGSSSPDVPDQRSRRGTGTTGYYANNSEVRIIRRGTYSNLIKPGGITPPPASEIRGSVMQRQRTHTRTQQLAIRRDSLTDGVEEEIVEDVSLSPLKTSVLNLSDAIGLAPSSSFATRHQRTPSFNEGEVAQLRDDGTNEGVDDLVSKTFVGIQQREWQVLCPTSAHMGIDDDVDPGEDRPPFATEYPPCFIGTDGVVYDKFYNRASQASQSGLLDSLRETSKRFPLRDDHRTYWDFEQAVLDWHREFATCEQRCDVKLPSVMGAHFYRPTLYSANGTESADGGTTARDENGEGSGVESSENEAENDPNAEVQKPPRRTTLWGSRLAPNMPQPEAFDTYEEYEEAVKRWTIVCGKVDFLPPHPDQMRDILLISTASDRDAVLLHKMALMRKMKENRKQQGQGADNETSEDWHIRSGLVEQGMQDPLYHGFPPPRTDSEEGDEENETIDHKLQHWAKMKPARLPPALIEKIQKHFVRQLERFVDRQRVYGHGNVPLIPRMHGTFPRPVEGGTSLSYMFAMEERNKNKPRELRRMDLTRAEIAAYMDCPAEIDDMAVEFNVPPFDVYNTIDLGLMIDEDRLSGGTKKRKGTGDGAEALLHKQKIYMLEFKSQLDKLDSHRFDKFYSWYHPKIDEDEHDKYRKHLDDIMVRCGDEFTVDDFRELLSGDLFLDHFQAVEQKSPTGKGKAVHDLSWDDGHDSVTYLKIWLNSVTPALLPKILEVFGETNDRLTHAKLAHFMERLVQSEKGIDMLTSLLRERDILSLNRMAYALTFFVERKVDIYSFHPTTLDLVLLLYARTAEVLGQNVGDSRAKNLLESILAQHYLMVLSDRVVVTGSKSLLYTNVKSYLRETTDRLSQSIGEGLQRCPSFLSQCFKLIGHRSSSISSILLLILVQLLRERHSEAIRTALLSDMTALLDNVRELTLSKFLHTQYAAKHLFSIITTTDPWASFVSKSYTDHPQLLKEDLVNKIQFPQDGAYEPVGRECRPNPLLQQLTIEMCTSMLRGLAPENLSKADFLLRHTKGSLTLFHSLITLVLQQTDEKGKPKKAIADTTVIASLIAEFARAYTRHGLIEGAEKHMKRGSSTPDLAGSASDSIATYSTLIISQELRCVLLYVNRMKDSDEVAYSVKTHLLQAVRSLCTVKSVFALIRKDSSMFEILADVCRDGSHLEYNRVGWKFFYELIRFHTGVLEYLIASKLLALFTECIGVAHGNTVMVNCLHYFTKIFWLPTREQQFLSERGETSRGEKDTKAIDKDVKLLTSIIASQATWVKVHMIYKRLTASSNGFPGGPFKELAALYRCVNTNPNCQSLFKQITKNPEYKDGLNRINKMFATKFGNVGGSGDGGGVISPRATPRGGNDTEPASPSLSKAVSRKKMMFSPRGGK